MVKEKICTTQESSLGSMNHFLPPLPSAIRLVSWRLRLLYMDRGKILAWASSDPQRNDMESLNCNLPTVKLLNFCILDGKQVIFPCCGPQCLRMI